MRVEDCVVRGPLPLDPATFANSPLNKWPEDVRYSSGPLRGIPQTGCTVLRNASFTATGSEIPACSRVVAQTFNIPGSDENQVLEKIFILAMARLNSDSQASDSRMKFQARLIDLGEIPVFKKYEAGANLLQGNAEFEISTPPLGVSEARIVSFVFTGNDRVRLKKNRWYAFEIVSNPANHSGAEFTWIRALDVEMPNAFVFRVPFTKTTKTSDPREAIENRQAFIGIQTKPTP